MRKYNKLERESNERKYDKKVMRESIIRIEKLEMAPIRCFGIVICWWRNDIYK